MFCVECGEKSATSTRNELTAFGTSGFLDDLAEFRHEMHLERLAFADVASSLIVVPLTCIASSSYLGEFQPLLSYLIWY